MLSVCLCVTVHKHVLVVVACITWKSVERRSVMARTADIQVNAKRGRTTQELHRDALSDRKEAQEGRGMVGGRRSEGFSLKSERPSLLNPHI